MISKSRPLLKRLPLLAAVAVLAAGPSLAAGTSVKRNPRFQPCEGATCRSVTIAPEPAACAPGECGSPGDAKALDVSALQTVAVIPLYDPGTAVAQQLAPPPRPQDPESLHRIQDAVYAQLHLVEGSKVTFAQVTQDAKAWNQHMEAQPAVLKGGSSQGNQSKGGQSRGTEFVRLSMNGSVAAYAALHAGFISGSLPMLMKGDTADLQRAVTSGKQSLELALKEGLDSRVGSEAYKALVSATNGQWKDELVEQSFRRGFAGLRGEHKLLPARFILGMWTALALASSEEAPTAFTDLGRDLALMFEKDESLRADRWMAPKVRVMAAELDKGASRSEKTLRDSAEFLLTEVPPVASDVRFASDRELDEKFDEMLGAPAKRKPPEVPGRREPLQKPAAKEPPSILAPKRKE